MAQWPTSPAPVAAEPYTLDGPTLISVAQSMKEQRRTRGGQRWGITLSYRNLTRAQLAALWGFLIGLRGKYGTCTFVFPSGTYDQPQGTWAGSPVADGASQVGTAINLRGFSAGATGKAGDFLKFSDTKVYALAADLTADGTGKAVANLNTGVIVSPADGETVVSASVPFTVRRNADQQKFPIRPPMLQDLDIELFEAY